MINARLVAVLFAFGATALSAQARSANADPDVNARQSNAPVPAGWQLRLDRANADRNGVAFSTMGSGLHVTSGPAAIFWSPANTVQNTYTVEATFTQMKAPTHPEAYGLFWGGINLSEANQEYLYFVIRKDGKYLVRHRAGAETHNVAEWTEHAAIVKEGADGKQSNTLRVEVTESASRLFANGQLIREVPRSGMAGNTNGIAGFRVNHNLDVHIEGFAVRR